MRDAITLAYAIGPCRQVQAFYLVGFVQRIHAVESVKIGVLRIRAYPCHNAIKGAMTDAYAWKIGGGVNAMHNDFKSLRHDAILSLCWLVARVSKGYAPT